MKTQITLDAKLRAKQPSRSPRNNETWGKVHFPGSVVITFSCVEIMRGLRGDTGSSIFKAPALQLSAVATRGRNAVLRSRLQKFAYIFEC